MERTCRASLPVVCARKRTEPRFGPLCLVAVVSTLTAVGVASGLPPGPELDKWNESGPPYPPLQKPPGVPNPEYPPWKAQDNVRRVNNCYNYAMNKPAVFTDLEQKMANPGKGVKWPNLQEEIDAVGMCTKVKKRAIDTDKLKEIDWNRTDPMPEPPEGYNLVVLGTIGGVKGRKPGADYHWWRRNGDLSWSHKPGRGRATIKYTERVCSGDPPNTVCGGIGRGTCRVDQTCVTVCSGDPPNTVCGPGVGGCPGVQTCGVEKPLTDPTTIDGFQRNGYEWCALMGVPKNVDIGPLSDARGCGPRDGATWLTSLESSSGMSDPEVVLSAADEANLLAIVSTILAGSEVPNPQWTGVSAGQSAGFLVVSDDEVQSGLPHSLHVFLGVVEVVALSDVSETNPTYYTDINNQLQSFLTGLLVPPEGACCTTTGCVQAAECQCVDSGNEYRGDGTPCGLDGTCIPTVSTWGLAVMTLLVLTAATVVIMRRRASLITFCAAQGAGRRCR